MHVSNGPGEGAASPLFSRVLSSWALGAWSSLFPGTGGVTRNGHLSGKGWNCWQFGALVASSVFPNNTAKP